VSIVFLSVFCLGGGGMSLRAAGNHLVEKVIIARKKYQKLLNHRQCGRRSLIVFINVKKYQCPASSSISKRHRWFVLGFLAALGIFSFSAAVLFN
jgi:hypothetical protein